MNYYTSLRRANKSLSGLEIFDIKPIPLGGDPSDPKNKATLTRQQHIEAARYWNKIIKRLRAGL